MKVAAPYEYDERYTNLPDEYFIQYTETSSVRKLVDFCKLYPNKRIVVSFVDMPLNYEGLRQAREHNLLLTVMLYPEQLLEMPKLQEEGVPYFFSPDIPCYSLSLLDMMIAQGISDIYLSDALCYHMADVKQRCREKGIRTRLILNSVASVAPNKGVDVKAPFFFPRDTGQLSKYIDICEFDCGTPYNWNRFMVYYNAWIVYRFWYGDLNEIVPELELSFQCQTILPNLTTYKYNCGRRCSLGGHCRRCKNILTLSENMSDKGAILDRDYQGNFEKEE